MHPAAMSPLESAELAIERAAAAAWRRRSTPPTFVDHLGAVRALQLLAQLRAEPVTPGVQIELIRLAALQAVRAAIADDDMLALELETSAAVAALSAA